MSLGRYKMGPIGYILAQVVWMIIVLFIAFAAIRTGNRLPLWTQISFWITVMVFALASGHIGIMKGPQQFHFFLNSTDDIVRTLIKLFLIGAVLFLLIWGFKVTFL